MEEIFKKHGISSIPPEMRFMGDFRQIRNDLVHTGEASRDYKWFKRGESIILGLDFVIEFLNEMGAINLFLWKSIFFTQEEIDKYKPEGVRLISFKTLIDNSGENRSVEYFFSCVFSDGVLGKGKLSDLQERMKKEDFLKGEIDGNGDVVFPEGTMIKGEDLYSFFKSCLLNRDNLLSWMPGPEFILKKD